MLKMDEFNVYFAKLNLASNQLYKILSQEEKIEKILQELLNSLESGITYKEQIPIPLTEEEIAQGLEAKFETIEYRLDIHEKKALGVEGIVFRTSKLYYNKLEKGNSLVSAAVNHTDGVRFYLDVFNEYIGFNRKHRFGYQQFINSFEQLINICLEKAEKKYKFSISLYTEGLNLEEIKSELKRIKNIERLEIKIQPPNPDDEILDKVESSLGKTLEELEEAKASALVTLIEARGEESLNIDSKLVEKELGLIEDVHGFIGTKKATSRGYVKVKAETRSGVKFTTDENRPKTIKCDNENFIDKVRGFIAQILVASSDMKK